MDIRKNKFYKAWFKEAWPYITGAVLLSVFQPLPDDFMTLLQSNRLLEEFPQIPGKTPVHLHTTNQRHFPRFPLNF